MSYRTLPDYLADPEAPERPELPPGGSCGPKDDAHMTFLAMTVRRKTSTAERLELLRRQAILLESIAPGDPCIARMMEWHRQLEAESMGVAA